MERKSIQNLIRTYVHDDRCRLRWRAIAACLSVIVLAVTVYLLILPAATLEQGGIALTANKAQAVPGEELLVTLEARPVSDGELVCYIAAYGENAGLSNVNFDNDCATLSFESGRSVILHREVISGSVGYWFVLPAGSASEQVQLQWMNGIGRLLVREETSAVISDPAETEPAEEETVDKILEGTPDVPVQDTPKAEDPKIETPEMETPAQEVPAQEIPAEEVPAEDAPEEVPPEAVISSEPTEGESFEIPVPEEEMPAEPSGEKPMETGETNKEISEEDVWKEDKSTEEDGTSELEKDKIAAQNESSVGLPASREVTTNKSLISGNSTVDGMEKPAEKEESPQNNAATVRYYIDQAGDAAAPGSLTLMSGSGRTLDEARAAAFAGRAVTLSWAINNNDNEEELPAEDGTSRAEVFPAENSGTTMRRAAAAALRAPGNGTGTLDLTKYLTGVTVEKSNGVEWTFVELGSGTVTSGDSLRLTINFTFDQNIVTPDSRIVTYQLNGIGITKEEHGIVKHGEVDAGTYTIATNGGITIEFNDNFADGQAFSGFLQFQCMVTASGGEGGDVIDFGFSGGTITVVPDTTKTDLSVTKTGYLDPQSLDKIHYSIKISSEKGTQGDIDLMDAFQHDPSLAGIDYDKASFSVRKILADGSTTDVTVSDSGVNNQTASAAASFYIRALPALGPGESYLIAYTATPDLSRHQPDGSLRFANKATAADQYHTVEATEEVVVRGPMVEKSGSFDSITGKTTWKITLNPDGLDISGMMLSDVMQYTVEGIAGTFPMALPSEVLVSEFDGGTWIKSYSVSLPYEFPPNSTHSYVISYETEIPPDIDENATVLLANKAILGEFEAEYTVTFQNPGELGYNIVKIAWDVDVANNITAVNWAVALNYPQGASASDLTCVDYILPVAYSDTAQAIQGTHYTTLELLQSSLQVKGYFNYQQLIWNTHFDLYVLTQNQLPEYSNVWKAYSDFENGSFDEITGNANWHQVTVADLTGTGALSLNAPIAALKVVFRDSALDVLQGDAVLINYNTYVDMTKLPAGRKIFITNAVRIAQKTTCYLFEDTLEEKLNKQQSPVGIGENVVGLGTYTDSDLNLNLYASAGNLHYRLLLYRISGEKGDVIVTDTLPEGMEFLEDSVRVVVHADIYDDNSPYKWEVPADRLDSILQVNVSKTSSGTNVTFTLRGYESLLSSDIVGIYYDASVADDAWETLDEKVYINSAFWDGVWDHTSAKVSDELPVVEKSGLQVIDELTGDKMDVVRDHVVINPEHRDLIPGNNFINLTDVLTIPSGSSAALRANSVALYQYDAGNVEGHFCGALIPDTVIMSYDEETHTTVFTLPDATACVLVYEYAIDGGTAAGNLQINNIAKLSGQAYLPGEHDLIFEQQTSSAGVNKASVNIYKYGGTDYANLLSGAKFELDRFEDTGHGYQWNQTSLTADEPTTGYFITDENGTIVLNFVSETTGSPGSLYHTLYRVTEKEAPEGYVMGEESHYFVWLNQGATAEAVLKEMQAAGKIPGGEVSEEEIVFIPYSKSHTIYVSNEPANLTVRKEWRDADKNRMEPTVESVTVQLWQHVKETGAKAAYGEPVRLSEQNNWENTWQNLPKSGAEGETYYYTAEEVEGPPGFEIYYSTSNQNQITAGEIVVYNEQFGFILPETGGGGTTWYLLAGGCLMAVAGAGSAGLRKKRRKA